jgi:hypothetical protein
MLDQYFGPLPTAPALTPAREAQLVEAVAALVADSQRQGLSGLRIETSAGERPDEIRLTVSAVLRLADAPGGDGAC